jgi:Kinesin motor domain
MQNNNTSRLSKRRQRADSVMGHGTMPRHFGKTLTAHVTKAAGGDGTKNNRKRASMHIFRPRTDSEDSSVSASGGSITPKHTAGSTAPTHRHAKSQLPTLSHQHSAHDVSTSGPHAGHTGGAHGGAASPFARFKKHSHVPHSHSRRFSTLQRSSMLHSSSSGNCREAINVIVRCRPLLPKEKVASDRPVVSFDPDGTELTIWNDGKQRTRSYAFDRVHNIASTPQQIFESALPIVKASMEGLNGTIFAYGQTGSGKTHTMMGQLSDKSKQGVIPRVIDYMFEHVSGSKQGVGVNYLIMVSVLEIYNEHVHDLLGKDIGASLDVRQHPDQTFFVPQLSKHVVRRRSDLMRLIAKGNKNRIVAATTQNHESSRSHSMVTLYIEKSFDVNLGQTNSGSNVPLSSSVSSSSSSSAAPVVCAKLNLVDLAGSERMDGHTETSAMECKSINQSLNCLANVISALTSDRPSTHIPYRDSKLTRLLKDSLGGNAKTLMIACINPHPHNVLETLSTLRYASRAKHIKNKPKVNEDEKDAVLRKLNDEVQTLKSALAQKESNQQDIFRLISDMMEASQVFFTGDEDNDTGSETSSTDSLSSSQPQEASGGGDDVDDQKHAFDQYILRVPASVQKAATIWASKVFKHKRANTVSIGMGDSKASLRSGLTKLVIPTDNDAIPTAPVSARLDNSHHNRAPSMAAAATRHNPLVSPTAVMRNNWTLCPDGRLSSIPDDEHPMDNDESSDALSTCDEQKAKDELAQAKELLLKLHRDLESQSQGKCLVDKSKLEELSTMRATLRDERSQMDSKVAELQALLDDSKQKIFEKESSHKESMERLRGVYDVQLEQLKKEEAKVRAALDRMQEAVHERDERIAELVQTLESFSREIAEKDQQINALENQVQQHQHDKDEQSKVVKDLEANCSQLTEINKEQECKIESLSAELEILREELEAAHDHNDVLEQTVQDDDNKLKAAAAAVVSRHTMQRSESLQALAFKLQQSEEIIQSLERQLKAAADEQLVALHKSSSNDSVPYVATPPDAADDKCAKSWCVIL